MEIVLVVLLLVALAAGGAFASKAHREARALQQAQEALARLGQQAADQHVQLQHLSRYRQVADAERAASVLRSEAEAWATQVRSQASAEATQLATHARQQSEHVQAQARAEAAQLTTQARQRSEQLMAETQASTAAMKAQLEIVRTQAAEEARRVLEEANRRAEEIAGEALMAVRDAKRLEQTAQAMKNLIEGYGDQYVMPTSGLLDELAEQLGFSEAGQRLKAAREKVRSFVKQGKAATCDYVEANRRGTAIDFVLDAFNGKVDSILADVRHDNFGTLQQKIRDAYTLVNHNGRAFRDARILAEYLEARLEELKWAVVAQELKQKEREEQRLLKERIREEERAQREFEKAMKEAEKEEETLRKAMEKALRDVEKSSEAERARYEQRLLELSERLHLAEAKNQRALSMAQQTKSGHVYIISNVGSFGEHVYKIGMTRRLEPLDRVRELGDASVPFEFDVHAMIPSVDAPALEHALHRRFVKHQVNKVNPRKEFFRVPLHDLREELARMAADVTWTLVAEAREFRETQAIERGMADKTLDESAWLVGQLKAEAVIHAEREQIEATA